MAKILDCTLRDGGYVNNFDFGEKIIIDIISKLSLASIDIIECGFLKAGAFDKNKSLFGNTKDIKRVIKKKNPASMYVAMLQYGEIDAKYIENRSDKSIDGIRLTFHEHEIDGAFEVAKQLKEKDYCVFMQPVGTMTYTEEALLTLVDRINALNPYAFYIVDTLGTMYKKDLLKMFALIDGKLNKSIKLGFHSHNNLQLSFSNAQELLELDTERDIIIDSSIFGMGRGAGNLNTELVTQYINDNICPTYNTLELLDILDTYIKPLSIQYQWGYDAPYYISSATGCHPNYASYLMNKQTLRVQDIYNILNRLDNCQRALFNKGYIEEQYKLFMNNHIDDTSALNNIREQIKDKKIILIAPGKSISKNENIDKINSLIATGEYTVISINFCPSAFPLDMIFTSNLKRFNSMEELCGKATEKLSVIVTSNIASDNTDRMNVIDYMSYTNQDPAIFDNAGVMCLNMLKRIGAYQISLAGFDGFKTATEETFAEKAMYTEMETEQRMIINTAMINKLSELSTQMSITFLTDSYYDKENLS